MRTIILCILIAVTTNSWAQSKKELEAQIVKLKAEIDNLKKPKEADLSTPHKKASYSLGVLVGANFKRQGADSLDAESFAFGIAAMWQGKTPVMSEQECMTFVQPYMQGVIERKARKASEEGTAYLAANKTKEGVVSTASGLQYKIVTKGAGTKTPTTNDNVSVNYSGTLIDGTPFDSSIPTGKPATFRVTGVIQGWIEVLQLMHEGDKFMVYIPYDLGYGDRGNGKIPPFATLVFELELIKIN